MRPAPANAYQFVWVCLNQIVKSFSGEVAVGDDTSLVLIVAYLPRLCNNTIWKISFAESLLNETTAKNILINVGS